MKQHFKPQIEKFCESLWSDDHGSHRKITVGVKDKVVTIKVEQMYDHVDHSFKVLNAISQFFGTTNIESSEWSSSGCDTCDYGSNYTIEFTVKEDAQ